MIHDPTPTRLGPRPLALHLLTQASTLLTSQAVLPSWRSGSFAWKPHLQEKADELRRQLAEVDPEAFRRALKTEAFQRLGGFLDGVEAYRNHPSRRDLPEVPVVWQEGSSRLLDYSLPHAAGPAVLVVPSLINRAYILDLSRRRSLMRALADRGLRPYLVDWDAPGPAEKEFGLDDYIAGRLSRMLDVVAGAAGRPAVVGYCMGGLLGLGLGVLRQKDISGLALLATPWDFHAPGPEQAQLVGALEQPLEDAIALAGELPVDLLQSMFSAVDPGAIERKFRRFGRMDKQSAKARAFVAVEDWLNDGVPLTATVARECLFGWYVGNTPGRGLWRVAGVPVQPAAFAGPALVVIPALDSIVPPASARALAENMPRAALRVIETGHIGMVTGARARMDLYTPLARWVMRIAADEV